MVEDGDAVANGVAEEKSRGVEEVVALPPTSRRGVSVPCTLTELVADSVPAAQGSDAVGVGEAQEVEDGVPCAEALSEDVRVGGGVGVT